MTARPFDMTEKPKSAVSAPDLANGDVDVLSEVLRAVRLRGAVYYNVQASTPWVAEAPVARELAPFVMPGSEHVIEYHVVMSGSCWGGLIGEPAVFLEAGAILVFPHGVPPAPVASRSASTTEARGAIRSKSSAASSRATRARSTHSSPPSRASST